jgi:vanillate O-demethylase monooxygenase subunit
MSAGVFLRNQWYAAAAAHEVGAKPLARKICNEEIVLFRGASGKVAALEDRCPHRMAPLSLGEVVGDELQCGYHGVRLTGAGVCTRIPSEPGKPVPRGFGVRSYPVVETHALIFVWLGDAEKADPALLPEFGSNTAPGWAVVHGYHYVEGNYLLLVDNLLDLTHVTFTHKTTLASEGVAEAPFETWTEGEIVHTKRVIRNIEPAPIFRATRGLECKIDRWQISWFQAPVYVLVTLGAEPAGTTEELKVPSHYVLNSCTPETERTTHYFWSVTRNLRVEDEALSRKFRELIYFAFNEDAAIIAAQQRRIDSDRDGRSLVNFGGDRGGVSARRIVARKLEEERGARQAAE